MAPVDLETLNSNLKPLLFLGAHASLVTLLGAIIARFYFVAHSSVPPSKHTRSRHAIERHRLPLFLSLGAISTLVALVCRVNWLAASFYDWLYEGQNNAAEVHGSMPLGLWWQDAAVLKQYFYGILENPTYYFFTFQSLLSVVVFSLFVGIEGRHRNLPVYVCAAFVLFSQTVGLAAAINLFFAILTLIPVPLYPTDEPKPYPDVSVLLAPALLAMTWIVAIPAFLDRPAWPLVSYAAYIAIPLGIVVLCQLPAVSHVKTVSAARKNYAFVFRCITLYAFILTGGELLAVLFKTRAAAVQASQKYNYFWMLRHKQELSFSEQAWMTFSRVLGTLSDQNPVVTGILWDVMLSGTSVCVWAYTRNVQVHAILSCLGLAKWNTDTAFADRQTSKGKEDASLEDSPRKKRGRPKKSQLSNRSSRKTPDDDDEQADDMADEDFSPPRRVQEVISMTESLALTDDSEEQGTESGALAWTLFVIGGLPTAICSVLGAELSGG